MKRRNSFFKAVVMLTLCMLVLSACSVVTSTVINTNAPDNVTDKEKIEVSTTKELLEAIKPDTLIVIKPGYYNMSEYIESEWKNEGERWNDEHKYVKLRECHDGIEVVISHTDGLSIFGGGESPSETELVVDPRYAAVLTFEDCHSLTLSSLTMGHTGEVECSGNVLDFWECEDISLSAMDIYGCGVYGIGAYNDTKNMNVYSSTVRDCTYGPMYIYGCDGRFEFRNCWFDGSGPFSYVEKNDGMELCFYECNFGREETEYFKDIDWIYKENCRWNEERDPSAEYSYDVEPIDFENMTDIPCTADKISAKEWFGYCIVNPESGETTALPEIGSDGNFENVSMKINADGTGEIEYRGKKMKLSWENVDEYNVCFAIGDNRNVYGNLYKNGEYDNADVWMLIQVDESLVWMH